MTFKSLLFVFIVLNLDVLCLSAENPSSSDCPCVRFHWGEFQFRSLLPKDNQYWKKAVCYITHYCLQKTNSSLLQNKTRCKRQQPPINVTFPFISENPPPNITFKILHRPVLAINDISSSTASPVIDALGKIWKLFALSLMAAALSGIIIWFFDHKANSGHFPKSFWSGIREGLWWAIVTMTTTGYGDKTPKSVLARVYAALWMITGLLLMSLITAQVSSSITADELRPLDGIFGKKVGVPLGSKTFFQKYNNEAESLKEYSSERELFKSLKNGSVDKIWLFECTQKTDINSILIVNALVEKADHIYVSIGVKIQMQQKRNRADPHLEHCLKYWWSDYPWTMEKDDGESSWNPDATKDETSPEKEVLNMKTLAQNIHDHHYNNNEVTVDKNCFKIYNRGKYRQEIKGTNGKHVEFVDYLLCGSAGLFLFLFIIGTLWEICLRARNRRELTDCNADVEKGAAPLDHEMKTMSGLQSNETIVSKVQ